MGNRVTMQHLVTPIRGTKSKRWVWLAGLPLAWISISFAQDPPPVQIETRSYTVSIEKRSRSGRIYKINPQESGKEPPRLGATLLFRSGSAPVMAFRVLKAFEGSTSIAIKRIKQYPGNDALEPGQVFEVLEKIGEFQLGAEGAGPPPIDETAEAKLDETDLKELEQTSEGTAQASAANNSPMDESSSISELDIDAMSINELRRLDTDSNWMSAQLGLLSVLNPEGIPSQVTAFGIRYATTLSRDLLVRTASVQDSLCLEFSSYFFKQVGISDDTYTITSLHANLRYNLFTGDTVGLFAYAGFSKAFVLQANNGIDTALEFQSALGLNAGLGFLYVMGPKWNLRFDYGIDTIGAGLVIRF
jgi:hypothetical protein